MKLLLLATAISCAFVAQSYAGPACGKNCPQNTAQADDADEDDNAFQAICMLAQNDNAAPAQGQQDQTQQPGTSANAQPAKILLAGSTPSNEKNEGQKPAQPGKPAADQSQAKILLAGSSPSSEQGQQAGSTQPAKKDPASQQQPEKLVV